MIEDKVKKIDKDFISSPLRRSSIAGGYIISAYIIGVIMSLITFVLAEVYIIANGGELISAGVLVKILGLILLAVFSNTSLVLFIVSFFNSTNAFATASTIIGTLIGFLTGIYLPIGQLPDAVRWAVKLFPVSHAAVLFRQTLMAEPLSVSFADHPEEAADQFRQMMGIVFKFGEVTLEPVISIGVLILTAVIFYSLAIWNISRKNN